MTCERVAPRTTTREQIVIAQERKCTIRQGCLGFVASHLRITHFSRVESPTLPQSFTTFHFLAAFMFESVGFLSLPPTCFFILANLPTYTNCRRSPSPTSHPPARFDLSSHYSTDLHTSWSGTLCASNPSWLQ